MGFGAVRMRALALCVCVLLFGTTALAQQRSADHDRDGIAVMNFNMCLDALAGLPPAGDDGRILALWPCHGRDNQHVTLAGGVLYFGAARQHRVEILSPGANRCSEREVASTSRVYRLSICRADDLIAQRRIDFDERYTFIGSEGPRDTAGPMAGDPLVVRMIAPEDPPVLRWEYRARTHQLRVVGTDLCLTPPSQDRTVSIPLYLDDCAQPFRLARGDRKDGAARSRVQFSTMWRVIN